MAELPDDTPPAERPLRRALTLLLKIAVSVGLLYVLIARTDTSRLWAQVRQAAPLWLV